MNRPSRILTKMTTGSAWCNVFSLHVRHVKASHLKLAKGLGLSERALGRTQVTNISWVILKMANGVDYQRYTLGLASFYWHCLDCFYAILGQISSDL